jgi:hypothetical protein
MFGTRRASLFLLLILASGLLSAAKAQDYSVDTRPPRGFMPNADQLSSPLDSIDAVSGKLNAQIPLASLPRSRGGFDLNLQYDSHLYDTYPSVVDMWSDWAHAYVQVPIKLLVSTTTSGGWTYNAGMYRLEREVKQTYPACSDISRGLSRFRVVLPDGSMHILHLRGRESEESSGDGFIDIAPNGMKSPCNGDPPIQEVTGWLTYYTADGSYLKMEIYADGSDWTDENWYLYYPDGRHVTVSPSTGVTYLYDPNNTWIRFTNGCYDPPPGGDCSLLYTDIQDAGGRHILIDYNVTDANQSTDTWKRDTITAPGPNGNITTTIDWQRIVIGGDGRQYNYAPSAPLPNSQGTPFAFSFWFVKYIQLPLSSPVPLGQTPPSWNSYAFEYSDNGDQGYGQLDSMIMPSGSQYTYRYVMEHAGGTADDIVNNNGSSPK